MKAAAHVAFMALLIMTFSLVLASCEDDSSDSDSTDDDAVQVDDDNAVVDDDSSPNDDDQSDDDQVDDDIVSDDDSTDDDTVPPGPGTIYPIVLVHGFFGWGEAGPMDYFYHVADDLRGLGFEVLTTVCSPINSMEVRANCVAEQIEEAYPGQVVNIVAHSQGGLDARYLISTLGWGDRVAALVTVSTPHYGTALADIVVGVIPGFAEPIIDFIMNLFNTDWDGFTELTHDYVENEFNPANPDDPNVTYYSYQTDAEGNCNPLLDIPHFLIGLFDGANDGVVPTDSARYGIELGVKNADHWAIIGQPMGMGNFDHISFYREISYFLKAEGF